MIILVIVAAFSGYFLASAVSTSQTRTTTEILSETTTRTSFVVQNGPTVTLSAQKNFNQETITKLVIVGSETIGGGGFCEGNLSVVNGCQGSAVVQVTSINSTSYIFPTNSLSIFLNVTITTVTDTGIPECQGASTSTTTLSYNSTSDYGVIDYSWSQSCSLGSITSTQNNT